MQTSYPLRVQAIRSRGQNPRLYVSFPMSLSSSQLPIAGINSGRCWSETTYSRVPFLRCLNGPVSG